MNEKLLNEIFYTEDENFKLMMNIISNPNPNNDIITNKHHIIPRIYFKKTNQKVDNSKNNLVELSINQHYLVHYYAWKCSKDIIKEEMASALYFMSKKLKNTDLILKSEEYKILCEQKYKKIQKDHGIKIMCIEDGKIFNSCAEAARNYNLNKGNLTSCIRGAAKSCGGKHFIKYTKNSEEERRNKINEIEKNTPEKILCLETGETFEYFYDFLKKYNFRKESFREYYKGYHLIKTNNILSEEERRNKINEIEDRRNSKNKILCLETGEIFLQELEVAKKYGLKNSATVSACLNGRTYSTKGLHFIRYEKELSEEERRNKINEIENKRAPVNGSKKVQCIETGEIFSSCKQAALANGLKTSRSIIYAIEKNQRANKYHWKYLT